MIPTKVTIILNRSLGERCTCRQRTLSNRHLAEEPLVVGAEQTKTKAVKDIEALYLRVEQSPCKISAPVREWSAPRQYSGTWLYTAWTGDWVASIMPRHGRVKTRPAPERSAFLSVPRGWDMAKSRRFCKSKSICVGWSGQYLDFALYRRRSAAVGREVVFLQAQK